MNPFVNQSWLDYRERNASRRHVCESDGDRKVCQRSTEGFSRTDPRINVRDFPSQQFKCKGPFLRAQRRTRVMIFILWLLSCCCKCCLRTWLLTLSQLSKYFPKYFSKFTKHIGISWKCTDELSHIESLNSCIYTVSLDSFSTETLQYCSVINISGCFMLLNVF